MTGRVGADALRIVVAGSTGRMGRTLIEAVLASGDLKLAGALETPGQKSKTVAVSKGTQTVGYTSGAQTVKLRR